MKTSTTNYYKPLQLKCLKIKVIIIFFGNERKKKNLTLLQDLTNILNFIKLYNTNRNQKLLQYHI